MKKNIFAIAAAVLALGMTACQPEDITPITPEDVVVIGDGGQTSGPRVKSTSDLHNTDWTSSISLADLLSSMTGFDMSSVDSIDDAAFETYLNFDGVYAHFTFSENVELWGLDANDMMQQITGIDYEYSYDGTTHTGSLNGEDEEGNPASLSFTYNDSTDAITFVLPLYVAEDTTNVVNYPMVFNRD